MITIAFFILFIVYSVIWGKEEVEESDEIEGWPY
jgi:hypothetical protein